jgi:GH15 family glucan-1,4-alpha-glucosidase
MYRSIADYGLIGDLHSAALVSKDGSIDYGSLPWLDSPTIFASLLDDEKGGFFCLQPSETFTSEQQYLANTNILSCTFHTKNAEALLHDFMVIESGAHIKKINHRIHRCLKVTQGNMVFMLTLMPRPEYAKIVPSITEEGGNRFTVSYEHKNLTLVITGCQALPLSNASGKLTLAMQLAAGEEAHIDLIYGNQLRTDPLPCPFEENKEFWQDWLLLCLGERCTYLGEFAPMISRSLLVLKLLTFQPTGAIAAAATTSIPETPGGERNWDYRFSWLRDAAFTLKALFAVGHVTEADDYLRWVHATYRKFGSRNLQIMYTLHGNDRLTEQELSHLKGYRNSRPVRIGNDAHRQNQWDIYGEVMDSALRLSDYAGKIDEELWPFFRDICTLAIENWQKPDDGIWEVRNGPHHFVYSKVMCWVALDRGITIARRYGFEAPLNLWKKERERIREDILAKGFDHTANSFVQKYGSSELDASLLVLPIVGFLPATDARVQGTVNACKEKLMHEGFLLRYKAEDGLKGDEGGFVLCNFWLVECLALSGNTIEAIQLLRETLKASNHLGLFSEEYDSTTHEMLGNFPQAFSHIGYINAVAAILAAESRLHRAGKELSFGERLRKIIPLTTNLNPEQHPRPEATIAIGGELKKRLGRLQGGFFNAEKGVVNYDALKHSEAFRHYMQLAGSLNSFNPEILRNDEEKKAFWINIYNVLIIHGVIEFDIQGSVFEISNFFGRIGYTIGGHFFTPDDIEHGILRSNRPHPLFPFNPFSEADQRHNFIVASFDYRIHFALFCSSSSCPPIEFYDAAHIDRQLDIAAKSFINRGGVEIDRQSNTLWLSLIFQWYHGDFGKNTRETIQSLLPHMDEEKKAWTEENLDLLHVRYLPYNWNMNSILQ